MPIDHLSLERPYAAAAAYLIVHMLAKILMWGLPHRICDRHKTTANLCNPLTKSTLKAMSYTCARLLMITQRFAVVCSGFDQNISLGDVNVT